MMPFKLMTAKFSGLAAALLTTCLAVNVATTGASAQSAPPRHPANPNYSYMAGPHTRVYVTKRSWLDAGVEVLPGERKFNDYATGGPNQYEYLDRLNSHMDQRRQPLNEPSDVGGYPTGFPLPPY
jgi:hypothetical protein